MRSLGFKDYDMLNTIKNAPTSARDWLLGQSATQTTITFLKRRGISFDPPPFRNTVSLKMVLYRADWRAGLDVRLISIRHLCYHGRSHAIGNRTTVFDSVSISVLADHRIDASLPVLVRLNCIIIPNLIHHKSSAIIWWEFWCHRRLPSARVRTDGPYPRHIWDYEQAIRLLEPTSWYWFW